ncbi:uncharacterized protein LOC131952294 [Physella acuta]|uniref:uncharacterized protein LOC131952294 n=1 Tax=Physella acuta TaxID=109671 RepID=UPI0027DDB59A|nr:uncharacterized protein LOC131952294 [Physella acuta]
MVYARLSYYLETRNLLHPYQFGFRPGHRAMDLVVKLLQDIREGFIQKRVTGAVFFDCEKAYDRVNPSLLLLKLQRMGVTGRVYFWLRDFLTDRRVRTKVNHVYSNYLPVGQGVPQGSSLSCLLFLVYVNDLLPQLHCAPSVYADDLKLHRTASSLLEIQQSLQVDLDTIQEYCKTWQLRMNPSKSVYCLFSLSLTGHLDRLVLKLGSDTLSYEMYPVLLGVTLDRKLLMKKHINSVCHRFDQAYGSKLVRLATLDSGASAKVLRSVYLTAVKSVLDYSAPIMLIASGDALKEVYTRHHRAVRYVAGLGRNSPDLVCSIMASVEPLDLSFRRAMVTSYERYRRLPPVDPMRQMVDRWRESEHLMGRLLKRTWVEQAEYLLSLFPSPLPFSRRQICQHAAYPPYIPPDLPAIRMELPGSPSTKEEKLASFLHLIDSYTVDALCIYTDGSTPARSTLSGYGVYFDGFTDSELYGPVYGSIFTAELTAIYLALQQAVHLCAVHPYSSVYLHTDSLSSLRALANPLHKSSSDLVTDVRFLALSLCRKSVPVYLQWVPSHIGIRGNEVAYRLAGQGAALHGKEGAPPCPPSSYDTARLMIHQALRDQWQSRWLTCRLIASCTLIRPGSFIIATPGGSSLAINKLPLLALGLCALLCYSINAPDGKCSIACRLCSFDLETIDHILACPSLQTLRTRLAGTSGFKVSDLWKNSRLMARLAHYLRHASKLLQQRAAQERAMTFNVHPKGNTSQTDSAPVVLTGRAQDRDTYITPQRAYTRRGWAFNDYKDATDPVTSGEEDPLPC